MKNIKFIVVILCILSILSGCVLFSNNGSQSNSSKKENPVSGGQK